MVRITNQLTVEKSRETLQLIVALIKGKRLNELLEIMKSATKLSKTMPTNMNQTSLNPKYLMRFALLKNPIPQMVYSLIKGMPCFAW